MVVRFAFRCRRSADASASSCLRTQVARSNNTLKQVQARQPAVAFWCGWLPPPPSLQQRQWPPPALFRGFRNSRKSKLSHDSALLSRPHSSATAGSYSAGGDHWKSICAPAAAATLYKSCLHRQVVAIPPSPVCSSEDTETLATQGRASFRSCRRRHDQHSPPCGCGDAELFPCNL